MDRLLALIDWAAKAFACVCLLALLLFYLFGLWCMFRNWIWGEP
jgi:hypothetical protein